MDWFTTACVADGVDKFSCFNGENGAGFLDCCDVLADLVQALGGIGGEQPDCIHISSPLQKCYCASKGSEVRCETFANSIRMSEGSVFGGSSMGV